jgi:hypothetical protein
MSLADRVRYAWLILVPRDDAHFERGRLGSRAVAILQEVWGQDPDVELLVIEPLRLPEFHARLEHYPREKIDPASDPEWHRKIQTEIRYGMRSEP